MFIRKNNLRLVLDFIHKHMDKVKNKELKEAIEDFDNIVYSSEIKEIILCPYCKGFGKVQHSELVDYHKNDYDYWYEVCIKCGGKGRLVRQKIEREYLTKITDEDKIEGL